ncbi:MAG TPA: ribosome rescue protein RqcH, partial [Thermoplasmata archaeon]|nr:ribosome rescue protein RqcH [Thermoplasmata archaeon]
NGRFALKFAGEEGQLFIDPRGAIFLTANPPGERVEPDRFLKLLRSRLENRRLERIAQAGFDRILRFGFGGPTLVVELFAGGNLILLEADDQIADSLRRVRLKSRAVLPGAVYTLPPGVDPREWGAVEFLARLRASKSDLVRTLAAAMGLGSDVAEEACERTGVAGSLAAREATEEDSEALRVAAEELIKEGLAPGKAFLVGDAQDEILVFRPQGEEAPAEVADLSAALQKAYGTGLGPKEKVSDRQDEGERIRASQLKAAAEFRERAATLQTDADSVLANFQAVQEAIALVRGSKGKALPSGTRSGVRPKSFILEVGGREVTLYWSADARPNANRLYAEAKSQKAKAEGAERAAQKRKPAPIGKVAAGMVDGKGQVAGRSARRKPDWYEKFRHTFTSDGLLVVAGRNAQENERVVKRHLGDKDVYVHAEVHGAASVVLRDGAGAPESSLREACAFAVCYSKLWAAGAASGDAFWVRAEQVSKSPPSGEFVARGAFFITGRKNVLKDLPLRLEISKNVKDGHEMTVASPSLSGSGAPEKTIICPGDREAADVAKEIARKFGVKVEAVQSLMPPGRSRLLGR